MKPFYWYHISCFMMEKFSFRPKGLMPIVTKFGIQWESSLIPHYQWLSFDFKWLSWSTVDPWWSCDNTSYNVTSRLFSFYLLTLYLVNSYAFDSLNTTYLRVKHINSCKPLVPNACNIAFYRFFVLRLLSEFSFPCQTVIFFWILYSYIS